MKLIDVVDKCQYQKIDNGYSTSCGHIVRHFGWKWQYCPYCGKTLTRIRKDWIYNDSKTQKER